MALSYDPAKLPPPTTTNDELSYAILVELRAIRIAIHKLIELNTPVVEETSEAPKTKAKAK